MKKFLLFALIMLSINSVSAEQTVGSYNNSYFEKDFNIEATEKNNKLETVFIGVESKDSKYAYILVEGKELELFKTALELARDKYEEWSEIAKKNNVTDMRKEMGISFPKIGIA